MFVHSHRAGIGPEPVLAADVAAVPVSTGLLAGIAAAVVAILLGLIIGFVVYRRRSDLQRKKLMQDYSEQLQMVYGLCKTRGWDWG